MDENSEANQPGETVNETQSQIAAAPLKRRPGRPTREEAAAKRLAEIQREKDFPEELRTKLQGIWRLVSSSISPAEIAKMSGHTKVVALGILTDKLCQQAPAPVTRTTNVIVNGVSREDAMALILGKQPKMVKKADQGLAITETQSQRKIDAIDIPISDVKSPRA